MTPKERAPFTPSELNNIDALHGTPDCPYYQRMEAALATSNCANCGRGSTAHVVTLLVEQLTASRAETAALRAQVDRVTARCLQRVRPEQAADYVLIIAGFSERDIAIAVKVAVEAMNTERDRMLKVLGAAPTPPAPTEQEPT